MTVINTNVGALMARTYAARANTKMTSSMERLSSGQRINSAADDAAGLAVANKMESQHRGIKMAMRNSQDGISLVQTAGSSMNEVNNISKLMHEKAGPLFVNIKIASGNPKKVLPSRDGHYLSNRFRESVLSYAKNKQGR